MDRKRENTEPCVSDGERNKRQKSSPESSIKEGIVTKPSRENVLKKLKKAAPFYFFLNRVQNYPETDNEDLFITFPELLCLSEPGELEHSVHFTMTVQEAWLKEQYAAAGIKNPKIDVYCDQRYMPSIQATENSIERASEPALRFFGIEMESSYGRHHTKMSLLFYNGGSARVIIHTGNLVEANEIQGFWISPLLPVMQTPPGESITNFKADLLDYLKYYRKDSLNPWIERLQNVDMSSVNVCFIASVPDTHHSNKYGFLKLGDLLKDHVENPNPEWQIIAQGSSLATLGTTEEEWLRGPFARALSPHCEQLPPFSLIYPSQANVESSSGGTEGCKSLFYSHYNYNNSKEWVNGYLRQWKSDGLQLTGVIPHIKTYAQVSPDGKRAGWFLLSSANVTKAAWGHDDINKPKDAVVPWLRVVSYEVGILFLPKFLTGKSEFSVRDNGNSSSEGFLFPYDLPLTPYTSDDKPFLNDGSDNGVQLWL